MWLMLGWFIVKFYSTSLNFFSVKMLSDELLMVKGLLSLPVLSPYKVGSVDILVNLLGLSIQTAIFIASGLYTIQETEDLLSFTDNLNPEEFCRKHGLRSTEESVRINFFKISWLHHFSSKFLLVVFCFVD